MTLKWYACLQPSVPKTDSSACSGHSRCVPLLSIYGCPSTYRKLPSSLSR